MNVIDRNSLLGKLNKYCKSIPMKTLLEIISDEPEVGTFPTPARGSFVVMGDTTVLNTDDWMKIWEKMRENANRQGI